MSTGHGHMCNVTRGIYGPCTCDLAGERSPHVVTKAMVDAAHRAYAERLRKFYAVGSAPQGWYDDECMRLAIEAALAEEQR